MFEALSTGRTILGAAMLGLVLAPGAVSAQDQTPEDSLAVTTGIIEGLQRLFPGGEGQPKLTWDEVVFGVPEDGAHAVTLRGIYIDQPDGTIFGLDALQLSVIPQGDGVYAFETVLPARAVWADQQGNPLVTATIDGEELSGVWARPFNTFLKLDLEIGEILITANGQPPRLTIEDVVLSLDLEEEVEGRYSGPSRVAVGDLALVGAGNMPLAAFDEVAFDTRFTRVDIAQVNLLAAQVEAMRGSVEPARLVDMLVRNEGLIGGMSIGFSAKEVMAINPDDGAKGMVGEVELGLDVTGLDIGETSMSLTYNHKGLATVPAPGDSDVLPAEAAFELALATLPNTVLLETLNTAVEILFGRGQATARAIATAQDGLDAVTGIFDDMKAKAQ